MVQLLVRLVAAPDHVPDVVGALRTVMRPAQQARGCSFAGVYTSAVESGRLLYMEEWDDACDLHRQFGTERFQRLMELLEIAADPPDVEFRMVSDIRGLEYMSDPLPGT